MRIDESRVYVFQFDTSDMGAVTFPMRAQSREEAADLLQKCLSRIQAELAMEFPRVSGKAGTQSVPPSEPAPNIPYDVLEMRIDTLMGDLGAKELTPVAKAQTILDWTGIALRPENYAAIITDLELIASGQKEVPAKGKKKP